MCPQNWGLHPNGNFSEENYHEPSDLGFSNKLSSLQAESPWTGKNFDCGSHGPFPRFTYRKWWCSRSMLVYPRVNRHLCWFNPPKTHALQPGPPDVAGPRQGAEAIVTHCLAKIQWDMFDDTGGFSADIVFYVFYFLYIVYVIHIKNYDIYILLFCMLYIDESICKYI
jgi:hypothetical protein